jgi:secreted PhoX family phosphatase
MTSTDLPTSGVDRRSFLRRSAGLGLGITFAGSLDALAGISSAAAATTSKAAGYGPLVSDPAGLLSLPNGFSYKLVAETGRTLLESGQPTPADPDGAASFAAGAGSTLVINHEIGGGERFGVPALPGLTYDPGARGGTTNLDVDKQGNLLRQYVSVAGTHNNCAGGLTPWGTWLTCEETEARAGAQTSGGRPVINPDTGGQIVLQQDHGYCFEVSPLQSENAGQSPVPLRFLGRFAHEAVAVDPATHVIYETEDANAPHGLFYRWVPPQGFAGRKFELAALPDEAGALDAMRCSSGGAHVPDLSAATEPGTTYAVDWVPVPDRLATKTSVRKQFTAGQVTGSRKLEGAWWGDGGCYFVASFARTTDGSARQHDGQVWFYDPAVSTVQLRTIFAYTPEDQDNDPDGPDNICVSPYGGVILAEDGSGTQHLVGVTEQGDDYFLARNEHPNDSEFAGPNFSPDNKLLFVNVQSPGFVFAIRGPWKSQRGAGQR